MIFTPVTIVSIFMFVTIVMTVMIMVIVIVIIPYPLLRHDTQNTSPPQKAFPRPIKMRRWVRRISQICTKHRSAIGRIAYHEHISSAGVVFAYFPAVVV
jgi:hypothetical protein